MHSVAGDECKKCFKWDKISRRSAQSAVVDGIRIRADPGQSIEIDGTVTPVHAEAYE